MQTLRQYASSPDFRAAVSRAQWAVLQTGLITSGLALFGVYVLATRINDMHLMNVYAMRWLPAGPLLVGLIAGSGYILAAWWFGVRVGARMIGTILLLQVGMFMACHYADFETRGLILRETGQPVPFTTYFDFTTRRLNEGGDYDVSREPSARRGYAIRAAEAACFAIGGALAALTLVGRPTCALCGGLVRRRTLGRVGGPYRTETLKRLQERGRLGDARGFLGDIAAQADAAANDPSAVELTICRCEVCGAGPIEREDQRAGAPAALRDPAWRIDAHGEFARQLFENQPEPRPEPQTA